MCCAKKVRRLWLLYTAGFLLFAAMTSCQQNRSVLDDDKGMSERRNEGFSKLCNFISRNESDDALRMGCFSRWSPWTECDPRTCVQTRSKQCKHRFNCKGLVLKEERPCTPEGRRRRRRCRDRRHTHNNRHKRKPPPFHVVTDATPESIHKIGADLQGRSGEHEVMLRGERKKAYSRWSRWTTCTKSCTTQRYRWCKRPIVCGNDVIRETAFCYMEGTYCQVLVQKRKSQVGDEDNNALYSINHVSNNPANPNRLNNFMHAIGGSDVISNSATESECGLSSSENASLSSNRNMLRIIGGRPTQHGNWPWQVAVLNRFKEAFCGGTLVAPRWVLTAAHCVRKRLYVRLGEHDLREKEGTELEMRVEMSISHPEYDLDTVDNDVALLRLPISVKFDKFRASACLPKPRQTLPNNQLCTIIGWGKRRSSDMFGTDILQEAQVPIVTSEECREVYEDYQITGNMFCAGYKRGRMDSCAGDSGGPLLCKDGHGRWTVFGITSFGEGCGKKGKFGIYTRLPNYVRWVHRVMKSF